jgi:hypothetical protein
LIFFKILVQDWVQLTGETEFALFMLHARRVVTDQNGWLLAGAINISKLSLNLHMQKPRIPL